MKSQNLNARNWRQRVIRELKAKIGNYCQGCSSIDTWHMQLTPEFLELTLKNRKDAKFEKFGNNTISIYMGLLRGRFPLTDIELLCKDCKYARLIGRLEAKNGKSNV